MERTTLKRALPVSPGEDTTMTSEDSVSSVYHDSDEYQAMTGYPPKRCRSAPLGMATSKDADLRADMVSAQTVAVVQTHDNNTTQNIYSAETAQESQSGSIDTFKIKEISTDAMKFIREHWGTEQTMFRIYDCIRANIRPLDMETLMAHGPNPGVHHRLAAAMCLRSILNLKQHGFIIVRKAGNIEISDIELGPRVTSQNV